LLLNLRELFDFVLGPGLDRIDVDVEKAIIEDVAHGRLFLTDWPSPTGAAMPHGEELMP
jgi:hypothetical protein